MSACSNIYQRLRSGLIPSLLMLLAAGTFAGDINIAVQDSVIEVVSGSFYGIQYHAETYNNDRALEKLAPLGIKNVRLWASPADFHPRPGVWQWQELDQKISEIEAAGYTPLPCLFQSEEWYTGSDSLPWWHQDSAVSEWQKAARALAARYATRLRQIIIFDEPNMLHSDAPYYMGFKRAAELYMLAAGKIKEAAPHILTGGPSAFGGWENGHFANYVLDEPGGDALLDFISCNIFLSWNADDATATVMDRTIWYEEAPLKIIQMLGERGPKPLLLDAYNFSALWKKEGELWTDPRNVSHIGAVYQAAAMLHAAKGGYAATLRWETLGGYGILRWYPDFEELPPWYSWRLIREIAGLDSAAQLLKTSTSETPDPRAPHHGGMNVNLYHIQPFALKRADGGQSLILINKYATARTAVVSAPSRMGYYQLYRLDSARTDACLLPLTSGESRAEQSFFCPPHSVTVIRYTSETPATLSATETKQPSPLLNAGPTPFNGTVNISLTLPRTEEVTLSIYDIRGRLMRTLHHGTLGPGRHLFRWQGRDRRDRPLASALYIVHLRGGRQVISKKVVLIK